MTCSSGVMLGKWLLFVIAFNFCWWSSQESPILLLTSSSLQKYAISSSKFAFPTLIQVVDMQRLIPGYISLSAFCWSVIVCASKAISFIPWENAMDNYFDFFCFNNTKIAAQIYAFPMSLDLSRSRLFVSQIITIV